MPAEWTSLPLKDICTKIGSGATPRGGDSVYLSDGEVSLIRSQNVYNNLFTKSGLVYLRNENAAELQNVIVEKADVLLNITGDSVARACQVPDDVLPARVNQHVAIIRPKPDIADSRFIRYNLVNPVMQAYMLQIASNGATRNALTKGMIESFQIPLPPLAEQKAIAHILGTLDDKIELSRKMNETLEAMARALFKSWFVDFDPVRKKQAGQPTGLPSEIDALFPGEFEDSALGEVPKGWWVGTIGDVADIVGGSTPSTSNPKFWVDGNHAWITPKDLSSANSIILMSSERKITDLGLKEITSGLLPQGSLVLSSRAPIGYLAINDMPVAINQGFIGMKPKPPFTSFFLLNWLKLNMSEVLSRANGSTFLEISKSNFRPIPFLIPPHSILNTFSQHTDPILSRLRNLAVQTRSLSVSRDTLLPKLISGELRVPGLSSPEGRIEGKDAERFVGGANV